MDKIILFASNKFVTSHMCLQHFVNAHRFNTLLLINSAGWFQKKASMSLRALPALMNLKKIWLVTRAALFKPAVIFSHCAEPLFWADLAVHLCGLAFF